jgi:triacylglycerol lipase
MDRIETLLEQTSSLTPETCTAKYPVVLLHGLGYRDDMRLISAWGRIPDTLRRGGARVFLGELDAYASIEDNAAALRVRIMRILNDTGALKVNIVAHSKGGLEARCLLSLPGMAEAVASLTTVSTPHHGTSAADVGCSLLPDEHGFAFKAIDFFASLTGDKSPDSGTAIKELSRPFLVEFNKRYPNVPGVYYQSVGSAVRYPTDDPIFLVASAVVRRHEGENDGIVPVTSFPWGEFLGVLRGKDPKHGISHLDMVDNKKHSVSGIDIPMVYVALVSELKRLDF